MAHSPIALNFEISQVSPSSIACGSFPRYQPTTICCVVLVSFPSFLRSWFPTLRQFVCSLACSPSPLPQIREVRSPPTLESVSPNDLRAWQWQAEPCNPTLPHCASSPIQASPCRLVEFFFFHSLRQLFHGRTSLRIKNPDSASEGRPGRLQLLPKSALFHDSPCSIDSETTTPPPQEAGSCNLWASPSGCRLVMILDKMFLRQCLHWCLPA